MAKLEFIRKIKKKDVPSEETQKKNSEQKPKEKKPTGEKGTHPVFNKIWELAGDFIEAVDETISEMGEIGEAGAKGIITVGAAVINGYDKLAAVVEWYVLKVLVKAGRESHDISIKVIKNKREIIKNAVILGAGCIFLVGFFTWATVYEYSYNGRALGVVREKKDVLEILELASEELSQEYGSSIVIDPETDISFRPVVAYGKDVDTEDDVLRRLTYMGEINAQASAIIANGQTIAIVENDDVANKVLEDIKKIFVTDSDNTKYEYIGFVEDVKIEPISTKLANVTSRSAAVEKIRSGGQKASEYIVQSGDSIYGICDKLGLSLSELQEMNPNLGEDSLIHVGDSIKIQKEVPLLTIKTIEVSTFAESIPFETEYQNSSYYYEGESFVGREGTAGKASVTARLTKYNGEIVEREDLSKETLVEPVSKIILKGTKKVPPKKGTGTFIMPVNGSISSYFGYRWGRLHEGIDIPASTGSPIKASDGGTVVLSGWYYGYGYTVIIDHGGNLRTLYGHCSQLYVSVGESVFQGQTIAAVGNTGNSYGAHCHFEVHVGGTPVDPMGYL